VVFPQRHEAHKEFLEINVYFLVAFEPLWDTPDNTITELFSHKDTKHAKNFRC